MDKIDKLWMEAYNAKHQNNRIVRPVLSESPLSTFILENGLEMRFTVDSNMYNFSKVLKTKTYEHVAQVHDCFREIFPDSYSGLCHVGCIICEPVNRYFVKGDVKRSGIRLFRSLWSEYLRKLKRLDSIPDISINMAYAEKDWDGHRTVIQGIKQSNSDFEVKEIAFAICDAFYCLKKLDPEAAIYLYPDNIGLDMDTHIKITNIGHKCIVPNSNYEFDLDSNSITVTYDPLLIDDFFDCRMLMPLRVKMPNNTITHIMGQIDTGAGSSGFSSNFYESASLVNLGPTITRGVTGDMDSIRTMCEVIFPNGYTTTLHGQTIREGKEISILIGMDLLSHCNFQFEPYNNGYKYKLSF